MDGAVAIEEAFSTHLNNQHWDATGEQRRNGPRYSGDIARRLLDPELCLADMDRVGIEHCTLSLVAPGVQSIADPREAGEVAKSTNDHAHALLRRYPDRFSAFAAVALQNPNGAADELERAVLELGFKGALINGYTDLAPDGDVRYLDEQPVWKFWERVAALNVPVYLHPRAPLSSQMRALSGYPELGGSAWAFGYETASHAVRLMLSGLFDAYPNLNVILGHLGEGLPDLLPRLQHRLEKQREGEKGSAARHSVGHYFRNNFWLTTSGHFHTQPLLNAIEQIGIDRLVFSVDYPFEDMTEAARWFNDVRLPEDAKRQISRGNAERLLRLTLSPTISRESQSTR